MRKLTEDYKIQVISLVEYQLGVIRESKRIQGRAKKMGIRGLRISHVVNDWIGYILSVPEAERNRISDIGRRIREEHQASDDDEMRFAPIDPLEGISLPGCKAPIVTTLPSVDGPDHILNGKGGDSDCEVGKAKDRPAPKGRVARKK